MSKYYLLVQPLSTNTAALYQNSGIQPGLDLYISRDIIVPGKIVGFPISLEITCELYTLSQGTFTDHGRSTIFPVRNYSEFWIIPHSDITLTPLRLNNFVGMYPKDFRGELVVMVDNLSDKDYCIPKGTRLFQLVTPFLNPVSVKYQELAQ